jgi:excisionase family DNA binding protein
MNNESLGGMSPLNTICARNGIGRSFCYEQIKAGRLVAVKVGSKTYIKHEDEQAWLQSLPRLNTAA